MNCNERSLRKFLSRRGLVELQRSSNVIFIHALGYSVGENRRYQGGSSGRNAGRKAFILCHFEEASSFGILQSINDGEVKSRRTHQFFSLRTRICSETRSRHRKKRCKQCGRNSFHVFVVRIGTLDGRCRETSMRRMFAVDRTNRSVPDCREILRTHHTTLRPRLINDRQPPRPRVRGNAVDQTGCPGISDIEDASAPVPCSRTAAAECSRTSTRCQ